MAGTVILTRKEIDHKLNRIAYQIYEANSNETEIVIAGIATNGYILAKMLKNLVEKISPLNVVLCKIELDKKNPINSVTSSVKPEELKGKSLLLVDDVLHSGTTLIYAVNHFLKVPLKQFKTAVLVDRNHKKYPIKADFKGISLSTSLSENISVVFEKGNHQVVLD